MTALRLLAALGALLGALGVALAAAAAHLGGDGGGLAHTASVFLILHGAALLGLAGTIGSGVAGRGALLAGFTLGLSCLLFSADLATRAFAGARLFPYAAPIGGSLMILSWAALALLFGLRALNR